MKKILYLIIVIILLFEYQIIIGEPTIIALLSKQLVQQIFKGTIDLLITDQKLKGMASCEGKKILKQAYNQAELKIADKYDKKISELRKEYMKYNNMYSTSNYDKKREYIRSAQDDLINRIEILEREKRERLTDLNLRYQEYIDYYSRWWLKNELTNEVIKY